MKRRGNVSNREIYAGALGCFGRNFGPEPDAALVKFAAWTLHLHGTNQSRRDSIARLTLVRWCLGVEEPRARPWPSYLG